MAVLVFLSAPLALLAQKESVIPVDSLLKLSL